MMNSQAFLDAISIGGFSFSGYGDAGPSVGNYSYAQLFNPAASGKIVLLDEVWVANVNAATSFRFAFYNTALTTVFDTPANWNVGGAAPSALIRTDLLAAATTGTYLYRFDLPANTPREFHLPRPIVLGPGEGFVVNMLAANLQLYAGFVFREYAGG